MKSDTRDKFQFVEGTRGIAALQVVVLHYCASFLPAFARVGTVTHFDWESRFGRTPLFFVADGYTAVFIFFLMSGFVLAPSLTSSNLALSRQVTKRFLRLFIPVTSAIVLAVGLALLFHSQSTLVASLSHSSWVAWLFHNPLTWQSLGKEILANSMILGYHGPSIFSTLAASTHYFALSSMSVSMDPPLWTLHAEFWGSMLLVALAKLYRTLGRRAFWTMFVVALLVTGTSYFTLFLLGFAAYWSRHFFLRRRNALSITLGVVAIVCGILTATTIDNTYFADAMNKTSHIMWFHSDDAHQFQSEVAATLIMLGMLLLPASRSLLSMRIPLWLGKVSFSLYLIHFPILFTVGFAVFGALLEQLSYMSAVLLTTLIVGSFTLICAACFERWVDRPAVAFARRVAMRPRVERAKTPV